MLNTLTVLWVVLLLVVGILLLKIFDGRTQPPEGGEQRD